MGWILEVVVDCFARCKGNMVSKNAIGECLEGLMVA
jgi:hypothetical protein